MIRAQQFYRMLLEHADSQDLVDEVILGLTWTLCRSGQHLGLAMSPELQSRTLPWAGSLRGRPLRELAAWVEHWDPYQSSVGMAAINAVINSESELPARARVLDGQWPGNLAVFEHFLPYLKGQRVVVVGRYPGMDQYLNGIDVSVLEMSPSAGDFPSQAAEYLLPEADWLFLSGTTIANKTFPRLTELARNTTVVLMGPTVPWLEDLADYGVDYLAGVLPQNPELIRQTVMEGGGTRLFDGPVRYGLIDLASSELGWLDNAIDDLVSRRNQMLRVMAASHLSNLEHQAYLKILAQLDSELLELERRHRQMWGHNKLVAG